jgi:hypothetical protein
VVVGCSWTMAMGCSWLFCGCVAFMIFYGSTMLCLFIYLYNLI